MKVIQTEILSLPFDEIRKLLEGTYGILLDTTYNTSITIDWFAKTLNWKLCNENLDSPTTKEA